MSKVKSYGLKPYIVKAFDLYVGKILNYQERGGDDSKEHTYEVKAMYPFCILLEDIYDRTRICPCYSKLSLMLRGIE